ncbi:hypothetical protein [Singulisphaera sp. PoT]|uniref:hypothetical protein n=1 Tax=Singulisphaera sp. PoT TaxID=3411797 RepID=UPI003BF4F2A3
MSGLGTTLAFLGSMGPREILVVAVVALVLYGRAGAMTQRHVQALRPGQMLRRRWARTLPGLSSLGDRLFWFFAITAAAAVAAWIVTSALVSSRGTG